MFERKQPMSLAPPQTMRTQSPWGPTTLLKVRPHPCGRIDSKLTETRSTEKAMTPTDYSPIGYNMPMRSKSLAGAAYRFEPLRRRMALESPGDVGHHLCHSVLFPSEALARRDARSRRAAVGAWRNAERLSGSADRPCRAGVLVFIVRDHVGGEWTRFGASRRSRTECPRAGHRFCRVDVVGIASIDLADRLLRSRGSGADGRRGFCGTHHGNAPVVSRGLRLRKIHRTAARAGRVVFAGDRPLRLVRRRDKGPVAAPPSAAIG